MFKTQKQPKKSVGIIGLFEDSNSKKFTTTAEKISESMELQNYYKNDKKFEQAGVKNVFNFNFPTVDHKGEKNMKGMVQYNNKFLYFFYQWKRDTIVKVKFQKKI